MKALICAAILALGVVGQHAHHVHEPQELQMMEMDMMWMYFWTSDKGQWQMNFLFNNLKTQNGGQFFLGLACSFLFCIIFELLQQQKNKIYLGTIVKQGLESSKDA